MMMDRCCIKCLSDKWTAKCPPDAPPEAAAAYLKAVQAIACEEETLTSPEKDYLLGRLWAERFGPAMDYGPVKAHFNALLMAMEPELYESAMGAADPLRRAVQYAMTGNFIDFAAMDSVDESALHRFIAEAHAIPVDDAALAALRRDVSGARRLTCILDNCGEIVMDRVLMRVVAHINPRIELTAVVKGAPIVNDATREDAEQARLHEVARVIDTGCGYAGVPEARVSRACLEAMASADLLVAKGQANYETLCGCGLNLYYIFMCKCELFMKRFHAPRFGGILTREAR